jgi:hypothetical protein
MILELPKISNDAAPAFTDAKTCAAWLKDFPLTNVAPAHAKLLGELEELNCFEMPPGERLRVLELLREPVLFVQTEQSRRFSGKPVPLAKQERELFLNVIALWTALSQGWQHCVQDLEMGRGGVSGQAGLICQRALWCAGMKLAENYKAFQDFGADEWRRINQVYALAEQSGVAQQKVAHPAVKLAAGVSCAETFAQIQLMALANPNEYAPRQQAIVARWIEQWTGKTKVSTTAPTKQPIAPLSVDLQSASYASRTPKDGAAIAYMDTAEIGKSLKWRVASLKKGDPPESMGLGTDVTEGLAAQMLVTLDQQWCEDRTARKIERRSGSGHAQVSVSIAAMHYFITGRPFEAQAGSSALTQQQREHIETFGQLSTRTNEDYTDTHGFTMETWRILDESASGYRLERPRDGGSRRYLQQQLIAVRPTDATRFTLCSVRWISVSENQMPRLGVRSLPGEAAGVAARLAGLNVHDEKFVPALLLSAVPSLRAPATMIVPAGWFRPRRLIEFQGNPKDGVSDRVLLTAALERGSDFERCTFEPA